VEEGTSMKLLKGLRIFNFHINNPRYMRVEGFSFAYFNMLRGV
jgi:hypothetical protein